ncbi:hypothetical protein [Bdellovibrio sp. HCB209]|uniref:hypothetical protein n=1 Tax=Bdellovibrio sp. HCB209 TaxID=3394354 RepID=UPI0039B6E870
MKRIVSTLFIMLLSIPAFAAEKVSVSGYKKEAKTVTRDLNGPIHKIVETDKDFKLTIGDNAAFYLLPKGTNPSVLRDQLQSLKKAKSPVKALVNAYSRQIITLESN